MISSNDTSVFIPESCVSDNPIRYELPRTPTNNHEYYYGTARNDHDPTTVELRFRPRPQSHTGQCKRTGGCYNELVVAFFSTGGGVKGKNLYLLTLLFIYKLVFILFVMTPGAQTTCNIAVYGSAKQLVI